MAKIICSLDCGINNQGGHEMNLALIIAISYYVVGLILANVALYLCDKHWGKGNFGMMGIIYFGCMLLWPLYFPKVLVEIKKNEDAK